MPVGLLTLITIPFWATPEKFQKRLVRASLTAFFFAVVAAPLVIALSLSKGRLTSGDTGKIAYAEMVDGLGNYPYWRGEGNLGVPKHPARKLWSNPDVYEFAAPVGGTYPLWYDTSYWFDGLKARFDLFGQLRVLKHTLRGLASCLGEQGALIVVLVSLILWISAPTTMEADWLSLARLASGGSLQSDYICWYGFEARYVASFLTIIGMLCFGAVRLIPSAAARRITAGLALTAAAFSVLAVGFVATKNSYASVFKPRHTQWEVAQALAQSGVRPGDGVATIIDHRMGDYWARLAQVRIIEDIPF